MTTVSTWENPNAIAVNPVTDMIYVANWNSSNVTVINGATDSTTTVNVGTGPDAIAVNPVTGMIYVANQTGNTVTVINGATDSTTTVSVGTGPDAITVNSMTNKIYVANQGSGTVTVIDGNIPSAPVLASPANGALNAPLNVTLAWNSSGGTISYNVQLSSSSTFASVKDTSLTATYWPVLSLTNGTQYYWQVNAVSTAGTSAWSSVWSFMVGVTAVLPQKAAALSKSISFSNSAIAYDLPASVGVSIALYDMLGRQVRQLVYAMQNAGSYRINFSSARVTAGYYIVKFKAGSFVVQKKLALIY